MAGETPPPEAISLLISKLLGLAILAGACITKLPQVYSVWAARSGEGLSLLSTELENYCYLVHVSYGVILGLPVTAYGEAAAVWVQNFVLLALLYRFKRASSARAAVAGLTVAAVATPVYLGLVSPDTIRWMYDLNSVVYMAARLPQIGNAFKQGRTGQLSLFTNFLQFAGALVRIFTSVQEGAGPAMVRGFVAGSVLNGTVVAQILYYGRDGRAGKLKKKD